MKNIPLWKYCTDEQCREMLLSLELLDRSVWPDDKYLACLYALSNHPEDHYRSIDIVKKDGTLRRLYEPDHLLKQVQHNILHHILEQLPVSAAGTAYRKGSGIRENARPHLGKELVIKVDIENFYNHIMFHMVYQHAFPAVYFPVPVRTLLTNLCCYRECLPQGAPTSACISNLVMRPFDEHMSQWCREREITYTRYCDDITCSGSFSPGPVIRKLSSYLQEMGFYLNEKKTRITGKGQRLLVTGITVNEKLQVPREYRNELRKEIYYCQKYGAASHLRFIGDKHFLPDGDEGVCRYLQSLLGKINYVLHICPDDRFFVASKVLLQNQLNHEN